MNGLLGQSGGMGMDIGMGQGGGGSSQSQPFTNLMGAGGNNSLESGKRWQDMTDEELAALPIDELKYYLAEEEAANRNQAAKDQRDEQRRYQMGQSSAGATGPAMKDMSNFASLQGAMQGRQGNNQHQTMQKQAAPVNAYIQSLLGV